ncbi:ABC transporter ATP-binding protein [Pseudonocardia kongjuensis]|uniref:ABC transporter ATP-binding protein n=1 Tax=Pseudonocardia kongjuensis TaxID=102227 RepID=A0ABP4I428_9PSEU
MNEAILSARNVRKTYRSAVGGSEALRGVSMDVYEGESLAVVGRSGSGKSTLMHLLALLDEPTDGTILLDHRDTWELRRSRLNRARNKTFGFVFQQFLLSPDQTVLENVMLPLKIAGLAPRVRRERAMATLEQLELADKASSRATDLSGGQKQRVAIARAIVGNPRIVFADEPTGNLDGLTGGVVEDLLFTLNREQGIALVIVTHDDKLAARCDRTLRLREGRIVTDEVAAA